MKHWSCLVCVLTCFCCEVMYICTVPRGGGGGGVYFLAVILSELPITMTLVCIYTVFVVYWCGLVGGWCCGWRWKGVVCVCVLIKISNMGLCMSVKVSFICRPFFVTSYIWNLSNVLSLGPFFSVLLTCWSFGPLWSFLPSLLLEDNIKCFWLRAWPILEDCLNNFYIRIIIL
jgi:hypothetical protein